VFEHLKSFLSINNLSSGQFYDIRHTIKISLNRLRDTIEKVDCNKHLDITRLTGVFLPQ